MPPADYPLLLQPHLAKRAWGGTRLGSGIGEAWDLSVHPNGPCTIANGPLRGRTLAEVAAERGTDFGGPIRLLAKRLDCATDLSVQVHPRHGDPKTETWVVLEGDEGAGVYHGFAVETEREQVRAAALDGSLPELMRFVPVRPGDCIFVPSGTLHAVGGGLFLFELQQSADTTYRLFDWNRQPKRPLHLDEGLLCTDLDARDPSPQPRRLPDGRVRLVECPFFHVDRAEGAKGAEGANGGGGTAAFPVEPEGSWRAVFACAGEAQIGDVAIEPGGTVLVPNAAGARELTLAPGGAALVYGPGDVVR